MSGSKSQNLEEPLKAAELWWVTQIADSAISTFFHFVKQQRGKFFSAGVGVRMSPEKTIFSYFLTMSKYFEKWLQECNTGFCKRW